MASISISDSDSDDNGDLSSWTQVDSFPEGDETIEIDASSGFEGVIADEASVEKLEISVATSSASVGTATTTEKLIFLMTKDIGAIQHAAIEICF